MRLIKFNNMKKNFLFTIVAWLLASTSYAIEPQQVVWNPTSYVSFFDNEGGAVNGSMIWGDINNDGHLDVFIIVGNNNNTAATESGQAFLWKNDGKGSFTRVPTNIIPLTQASAHFMDYNNDGCLDLIVMGKRHKPGGPDTRVIKVYKNSGPPCYEFEEDVERSAELVPVATDQNLVQGRMMQSVDFDHDGWTDLIITGYRQTRPPGEANDRLTRIFKNVNGKFVMQTGNVTSGGYNKNFYELSRGSVHVGDINHDGYADIVVTGKRNLPSGNDWTNLYINNGDGTFREFIDNVYNSRTQRSADGETVFVDLNGDGYDDIVEVMNYGGQQRANIYINNRNETFTKIEKNVSGLIGSGSQISITAGDINNDGFLDLYITGNDDLSIGGSGKMFYNKGDGKSFTYSNLPEFVRAKEGFVNLVDIDRDGYLDYSCFGYDGGAGTGGRKRGLGFSKGIDTAGNPIPVNTPPAAPEDLKVTFDGSKYVLTWDMIDEADDHTPNPALRYNVYAENMESGMVYVYAPVDISTGRLKIGGMIVPLITPKSFEWFLPEGDYTFGVQAVDQADAASLFTTTTEVTQITGINPVNKNAVRVFTGNKTIFIENLLPVALPYTVLNVGGLIFAEGVCPVGAKQSVSGLTQGVYVVKTEENAVKVVVF